MQQKYRRYEIYDISETLDAMNETLWAIRDNLYNCAKASLHRLDEVSIASDGPQINSCARSALESLCSCTLLAEYDPDAKSKAESFGYGFECSKANLLLMKFSTRARQLLKDSGGVEMAYFVDCYRALLSSLSDLKDAELTKDDANPADIPHLADRDKIDNFESCKSDFQKALESLDRERVKGVKKKLLFDIAESQING